MTRPDLADPGRAGAARAVVVTAMLLIVAGVVLGGAVGYGLSWVVTTAVGGLEL